MAHGWDSYFSNLPPLSSDPGTLRRTSQSEGTLSQHIENFIGQHDFSGTVASHEAPVPNSDLSMNYCSDPSTENSSSDCVYQRYCSESQWQMDGEQMEKDYLQRCENNEVPDFTTDGLPTSGSFPSSFATDLQGLKQDCGMLATSFVENYSDVSSCSDGDAGETRPSCKFMASNSFPKPKMDVPTKHKSSEWFFSQTGNVPFPTPSLGPNISETSANLPSYVKATENIVEWAQNKMESPEKTLKSYAGHNQSSTTSMITENETTHNSNDCCEDQKQKEDVESDLTQGKYSDISMSGHENVTGDGTDEYPDGNEEEQITSAAQNTIPIVDNKEDHVDEKVLKKEIKEVLNQEYDEFDHPNSTDCQDRNLSEDKQDKSVVLKMKRKEPESLENEISDEHKSPIPNSTNCPEENMENDRQEKKTEPSTSESSDPPAIEASNSKDTTHDQQECTSTLRSNSDDVESSLHLSNHKSYKSVAQDNSKGLTEMSDGHLGDASVASLSESCSQPNSADRDINGKTNTDFSQDPDHGGPGDTSDSYSKDTSDKNKLGAASHVEPGLQPQSSSTRANSHLDQELSSAARTTNTTFSRDPDCSGPSVTSDSHSIGISDKNKQCATSHPESCLQPDVSNTDMHSCSDKEWRDTTSPDAECSSHAVTSDSNKQNVSSSLEFHQQPNPLNKDINACSEKELTHPGGNTNTTPSPDQQQSLHKSPVQSLSADVAENARESFEELDCSTEENPMLGMLYGEPLSREDSSCDTDETKLVSSQNTETSVARPDEDSMDHSGGQGPELKSSMQMRTLLHPVVILKNLKSTSHSYHCAVCQHTTDSVDRLFEHHYGCHSMPNFQFCKTSNLYLMRNEQDKKHLSEIIQGSGFKKKKQCIRCGLIFPRIMQYIKHMRTHTGKTPFKCNECGLYFAQSSTLRRHKRIPGRCKGSQTPVRNNNAVISETQKPSQKDAVQSKSYDDMLKCCVKLVDISKTNLCTSCGKGYSCAEKVKEHFHNVHKRKRVDVLSHQCSSKVSGENAEKAENEIKAKYKCVLCPRLFKYSYNRAQHLRNCVKDALRNGKGKVSGKYQCPLCHSTFTLQHNRYRHIKTSCLQECIHRLAKERSKSKLNAENELKTQSKETLQKKQAPPAITTSKTQPRYKCNLCPAVFFHASGKYKHLKKHELYKLTGKKISYRQSVFNIILKPEPSKSAKTEESMDHLKSAKANSAPTLSCHFCGKCFSTSKSLKKHEHGHRGERPYRCLDCGKGFKKLSHLVGHKIVHQRRIQCTVCRKILPSVGELLKHRSSHLQKGTLECPDCQLQFQFPAHLLRHLSTHKNTENKAPQLEEKTPLKPQESLESVTEQNGPNQLQCSLCKEVFNDSQVLRKHCLTHISGSSSNQCPFCKHNFSNRRYLLRHMIKHTGNKPFSCTNCGKQFYRHIYLKLHSQSCFPSKTKHAVTSNSNKQSVSNRHVVPVESNTKTKWPYLCSYCPRVFNKKDRLKNHHLAHKKNTLHLCSKCGQYFGINKLNQHQMYCRDTAELDTAELDTAELDTAELDTTEQDATEQDAGLSPDHFGQDVHDMSSQSSATKMLPFECPYCTQRYRYRSLLLRHIVSHTGVQPYPCMHCGHRYSTQSLCSQHEAFCDGIYKERLSKHKSDAETKQPTLATDNEAAQEPQADDDEANFKCKFCTKTFMKSRNLRHHILTHNEVKPYRCKACDSCFSRYDHLRVHQTHCRGKKTRLEVRIPKISLDDVGKGWQKKYGLEPVKKPETFDCEICARSFPTHSLLARHITMFHTTKLFDCARCGSSFAHERSLKKHRKKNKCRRGATNASLQLERNTAPENVTNPLLEMRSRILQRIQPNLNKHGKYVCNYCPRVFANSWQLRVHTRLHTGERPYSCDYCGQRFIRKDYVLRHYVKCTMKPEKTNVLCDRCGGFFHEKVLENHKKDCTSRQSSSASTAGQNKYSTSDIPPKGFSCAYCSSRFLLFSQLQEHFLSTHKLETMGPPVSTAPLQQLLSKIPDIKEEPLDESPGEGLSDGASIGNSFFCSDCNMSFVSKAGLTGHLRAHTIGHPFSCKICKKGFWNKTLVRNHYRKCKIVHVTTQRLEVPLKAEIDFALNDSVLMFKEGTKTTGTGVLQTNFSCNDDIMDESQQTSEENEVQSSSSKEKKTVQYQCSECDKSFTDGLMLISHLEDHGREEQEKKRNTCSKCGRVCSSQGNLEKHMRIHAADKKYSCSDCSKTFATFSELEDHSANHDSNRPYACKLCNQRFWTRQSLCNHYREDHEDNVFSCHFCSKTYALKKSLTRHYKKWHPKDLKDMRSAAQEKNSNEQQSSSQVSTTGESDENDDDNATDDSDSDSAPYFPCHVCGKTFPTSESLEDHQLCHLGEKPHECAECGRCFVQASQLQQHQRMHKSEFQCQTCGRGFVSLFALRNHKHTHGKSRPHRCSKCHLSFTGPTQLAEHMSTHREENFPCDICNRVFRSKSSRAEHRKSHSGDCPQLSRAEHEQSDSPPESSFVYATEFKYRCGVCNERFRDPEELSEHGCMKAEERPYSCTECNKHFLHASHLKKHRTTHLPSWSSREYPCNHCNSSFSSSQQFLSHLTSHVDTTAKIKCETDSEDGGPSFCFICPVCHQYFASAIELIHHFPSHGDGKFQHEKTDVASGSRLQEPERHQLVSDTEYECTECGLRFWGGDAFLQHHCSRQQQAIMRPKGAAPSAKTSSPTYYKATREEEEEVDVMAEDFHYCPVCSMQFSSKSSLLEHQNAQHADGKSFKCELCGKTFAKMRYLRKHEHRHRQKAAVQSVAQLTESNFKCTQCHTKFSTAQGLSLHMRIHAGAEAGEHRCDMCYKSFTKGSHLKKHQLSHMGEVGYECTECDKTFALAHLLEEHQQTHAGSSQ